MNWEQCTILVVDDETSIRRLLEKELASDNRTILTAADGAEARTLIHNHWIDVIIMDLRLPDVQDLELLIEVKERVASVEVIMITGHGDVDSAVEAMKVGAYDFIQKPFNLDRLDLVVSRAYQSALMDRENRILKHSSLEDEEVRFIGQSEAVRSIGYLIEKVAPARIPVLITGESGCGKDVVARLIHKRSVCGGNPMIVKNCASLQKELARSELFGHVKGSFTGATDTREGLIAYAHNSSLFLDEIGELSQGVQASLLRVLETGMYRRMGEKTERKAHLRLLLATNRNLVQAVEQGTFNEAFFHRINAFTIEIPPLRERREDLTLLTDYFLLKLRHDSRSFTITDDAMAHILRYRWPGNVRELRNVIERSMILAENNIITERCLPGELVSYGDGNLDRLSLEAVEKHHILKILNFHDGNRQKTADTLGISRKTLYRKLAAYTN